VILVSLIWLIADIHINIIGVVGENVLAVIELFIVFFPTSIIAQKLALSEVAVQVNRLVMIRAVLRRIELLSEVVLGQKVKCLLLRYHFGGYFIKLLFHFFELVMLLFDGIPLALDRS